MAGRRPSSACAILLLAPLAGCVERTISITSDPSGALVWLNDREVGRTPLEVAFVHYGTYDVRVERDGCEPLLTSTRAAPPLWDAPGLDLLAELAPGHRTVRLEWHYDLQPAADDRAGLLERAAELRARTDPDTPAPPPDQAGGADSDRPREGGASQ
jgi:hypothetical protein